MLPVLVPIAGLIALVLLVVLYWRAAQRMTHLQAELDRLRMVQRDMSTDMRARLEEGARTWESVEHEVRPRLDQLEPAVADLSATLEEHLPGAGEARDRLARVEERVAELEADLNQRMGARTEEIDARLAQIEDAVRTLRDAADERLADASTRLTVLEEAAAAATEAAEAEAAAAAEAAAEAPGEEGEEPSEEDAKAEDALAAIEAAAEAPATFGSPRRRRRFGWRHARDREPGRSGGRWIFVVLALALGLLILISTLG